MPAYAANPSKEALKRAQAYEEDNRYIVGHGEGQTREEAVNAAMAEIVRQISVKVKSSAYSESVEKTLADGSLDSRTDFRATIQSYTAPLEVAGMEKPVWLSSSAPFSVVCAIKRSKVEEMLDTREAYVKDLVRNAIDAEKEGQVDDALRFYYRAYAALQTLPNAETLSPVVRGHTRHLAEWIPQQMREICQGVKFGIADIQKGTDEGKPVQTVDLTVTYKDKPARSAAFTYFTGMGTSGIVTARDGKGRITIDDSTPVDPLTLDLEYKFLNESQVAGDIKDVIRSFNSAGLLGDAPQKILNGGSKLKTDKKENKVLQEQLTKAPEEGVTAMDKVAHYEKAMANIVKAIAAGNVSLASEYFTDRGLSQFRNLLSQGKASLVGKAAPGSYAFYPMGERVVCRSIPMNFSFDKGKRQFAEDVNFTFDKEGKVENIAFSLGSMARDHIFAAGGDAWSDYTKMVIVTFLENYRTAFALKDIDFIKTVFDDDAVIIVGNVRKALNRAKQGDMMGMQTQEVVTYTQKTKDQYVKDLEKTFAGNEYVNLRFYNTDVGKVAYGGEVFGIQLRQDYSSSHYGDEGYLYLLVDFNNPEEPIIKIRTWQPERRPDLTPNIPEDSPLYGIFSTGMFG